jgi:Holliday junction DNA helicase RuvB
MNTSAPLTLSEFVGNEAAINKIKMLAEACKKRGMVDFPHLGLFGPAGVGKTLLSSLIAKELGGKFILINSTGLKDPMQFRELLRPLQNDISHLHIFLFDEAHALNNTITNSLLSVMENNTLTTTYKDNGVQKTLSEWVPINFIAILATTDEGRLFQPLLSRCESIHLREYSKDESKRIAQSVINKQGFSIDDNALESIAERGKGTGRDIVHLASRICDMSLVNDSNNVTAEIANKCFDILDIDEIGLDDRDRVVLKYLDKNGASSISTLARLLSLPEITLRENIERYMIKKNLVMINSGGRELTQAGREHIRKSR